MKKIIIIDTYPSTALQEKILVDCIERIKPLGYSILLVSHYPVSKEIQQLANYYIYDYNNDFLPSNITPHFWLDTDQFKVRVFNSGHTLAITRNMYTSLNFCKSLGYDFFYFMEFDILFAETDLLRLEVLTQKMIDAGKSQIFFKPEGFRECDSYVYETLFFGGLIDSFLSTFKPPINLEDWNTKSMGYTLELSFFEKFKHRESDFLIVPEHALHYFADSQINVFRYGLFICELVINARDNNPLLFITNSWHAPNDKFVKVYQDGELLLSKRFTNAQWSVHGLEWDGTELLVRTYENENDWQLDTEYSETTFVLDKSLIEKYRKRGDIKYKMPHFYKNIGEDWFTYPNFYSEMVARFGNNAHFVEVGSWKGRSACYMAVEIYNSGKNIKFDCVDTWAYTEVQHDISEDKYVNLYDEFLNNISSVKDIINPVRGLSHIMAEQYEDNSLDFVFLDAAHDPENVRRDNTAWYRKVKKGGIIAGHDYDYAGVKQAVDEFYAGKQVFSNKENCWVHIKD